VHDLVATVLTSWGSHCKPYSSTWNLQKSEKKKTLP